MTPIFSDLHHYGYVVDDIERTVRSLVDQLGAGPFFLMEDVPLENVASVDGIGEFAHNSAFGYCGGNRIELIQPVRMAPDRLRQAFSGERPRVHHIAYALPRESVEEMRRRLDQVGLTQYMSAQLGEVDMTFHDTASSLGHDIEVHVDSPEFREFFESIRSEAESWDGSRPLRLAPLD